MSKINELVEKLCPNGVEFKPIWSVTIWDKKFNGVEKFKQNKVISYKYFLATDFNKIENTEGNIKYISTGISKEDRYTTEELAGDYLAEGEIVCIPWGGTPNVKYHKGKFVTGDNRIATSADINILNNKYLYYWICSKIKEIESFYRGSGIKHPNMKSVLDMTIAVPPLEVQDEIVHILDDFTLLSAELSAELKARQKQYEYYKGQLLSNDCKEYKLGEVAEFKTGTKPENILEDGNIEYINAGTTNSGYTEGSNISGDKVTTPSRGQGGIGYVGYQKNDFWLGPLCYAIWSKDEKILNNKYLYYELSSKKDEILKRKNTGGVPALNGCDLKTIPIKVPSLEEQMKIVNVLDNFEKICEDLVEGLPAEIEARRKQYEYYRDKLLTFKELVNEG